MKSLFQLIFPPSSFMPRWVIFLVDLSLCAFSYILATILRFNFFVEEPFNITLLFPLPAVLFCRMVFMIQFRVYAGIIRHTTMEDVVRIFYTILASTALIIVLNAVLSRILHPTTSYISVSILIIDSISSLVLMTTFRFGSKHLFSNIYRPQGISVINYAVFGAGETGVRVKQKIESLGKVPSNKKVVTFFDDDKQKVNGLMNGVPIRNFDTEFEEEVRSKSITELIIATNNISFSRKQKIIEKCLELDIHVRNIPPPDRWINGELSFNQFKQVKIEDLIEREPIVLDKGAIAQQLFQKNIMVTGAAGSIGREIAIQILKYFNPDKLVLVDKSELGLYELEQSISQSFKHRDIELVVGDITNEARMRGLFEQYAPSIIYHAAAYKHVPIMEENPSEALWVNIFGTKLLADLSVEYGVDRFVMVSTDKAVNPTNVMGASKRIAEIYVQSMNNQIHKDEYDSHTKFITTRFGNVLGSSGSVIPKFRKQIEAGGPVTVTHPDITRYFMTIPEACQLVLEAGNMGNGGEIYIFDMGQSVKIIDIARKMIKLAGLQIGNDIQIVFTGLRPGEKIQEELLADQETVLPTYHPKIMVSKVRLYDFDWVQKQVNQLIQMYDRQNNEFIVAKMKHIVPEFISQNSVYEELDYKYPPNIGPISKTTFTN